MSSVRFTEQARTLTTTSPAPGTGSGISRSCRTSGGPNWSKTTAFTTSRRRVDDLRARRCDVARPDDDPAAILDLLHLRLLAPVVVGAAELHLAGDGLDRVGLEPPRQRLVVEALRRVHRRLEKLPRRERARGLRLGQRVREAGLLRALLEELRQQIGVLVAGQRRVRLERGVREGVRGPRSRQQRPGRGKEMILAARLVADRLERVEQEIAL